MTLRATSRRYAVRGLLVAAILLAVAGPAAAAPAPVAADPDGGTAVLQARLREAAQGYTEAAARLAASRKRQAELAGRARAAEALVASLAAEVNATAGAAYRMGRIGTMTVLLDSGSPDEFLDRAVSLDRKLRSDDARLRDLGLARQELQRASVAVDLEIRTQQAQTAEMAKRTLDAERALAAVGGFATAGLTGSGATATPAPRNPDGTWPPESCSVVPDPTTRNGCLTPRTLHAYQQARLAGYTHYTACWRAGTSGEHPKGRACDFAAATGGFGGTAYGADKTYGDHLASWLIGNADRLGVLYVIWYRQIWMPGIGWRTYQGDGTPAGDHTNHVHLSVQ